ncbi:glycoside hydrolase family 5 protein [Stakelama marina]|uniref:Glycoside hydrolase family 5 protein n=1 Tax=Stakelama marina TaxID=2826939 RepID=A0A8T4ID05_9SPHN|nr:glycoside hydrolase family 5 protein [Stakelama marina]MBR0552527.1 glycoside hydrolase family 5 protein [Stakelama marina]
MFRPITTAALCLSSLAMAVAPAGAKTDSLPVGTCINLGNHLESPTESAWGGVRLSDGDLQNIADAGFDTVRIPVRWDSHAGGAPDYTIDPAWLDRVEHIVKAALDRHLNVILDEHNFDALMTDPAANKAELAAMWRQIAARFADYPIDRLWFEIANEPHDKLTNANLIETLAPSLAAIRETNPDRPVIIGGEFWSGIDSLKTLDLPDDPNIVPTFHYYEPFDFTHQGAKWVKPSPPPVGRTYGTADDAARLTRDVQKVRDYIARTGKTPFIGESGAYDRIPLAQRVQYTAAVHDAFAPLGIGTCQWAYTNTFALYDHKQKEWLPGMLNAIGLGTVEAGREEK